MNRRGFTLIELLSTLVILGVIVAIAIVGLNINFGNTKNKTEEVFIKTLEDALEIYVDSDGKNLTFGSSICTFEKTHGSVNLYKARNTVTFNDIINSSYSPLTEEDLVNPANEKIDCSNSDDILVSIYRDDDYIYYYKVEASEFGCLKTTDDITNLPMKKLTGCGL